MNRAATIKKAVWEAKVGINEAVFMLNHIHSGDYAGASSRTVNIEDVLRSKNYTEGNEFYWEGPYILHIQNDALDRDVLDHLQLAGAEQQPEGKD